MKNKHLVLLFFSVVIAGLLARRIPWRRNSFFQAELIHLDTAAVRLIELNLPNGSELVFERNATQWLATRDGRTTIVPPDVVPPMLDVLSGVHSLRIIKTSEPDSLGFDTHNLIQVRVECAGKQAESFELGLETLINNNPSTYLRLPEHAGIYLVQGALRRLFSPDFDQLRARTVARFDPAAIVGASLRYPDSVFCFWQKSIKTGLWQASDTLPTVANDTMLIWMRLLHRLNGSPFADDFDESQARAAFVAEISLATRPADAEPLVLRFYLQSTADLPEDPPAVRVRASRRPRFVVQSSQNPGNFFAVEDTAFVRKICTFPW